MEEINNKNFTLDLEQLHINLKITKKTLLIF